MPTSEMWSDVLTKPKSGTGSKNMRAVLTNMPANYNYTSEAKKTHTDLLPAVEKTEAKFGKGVPVKKTGLSSSVVFPSKQVRKSSKKTISWQSLLL